MAWTERREPKGFTLRIGWLRGLREVKSRRQMNEVIILIHNKHHHHMWEKKKRPFFHETSGQNLVTGHISWMYLKFQFYNLYNVKKAWHCIGQILLKPEAGRGSEIMSFNSPVYKWSNRGPKKWFFWCYKSSCRQLGPAVTSWLPSELLLPCCLF